MSERLLRDLSAYRRSTLDDMGSIASRRRVAAGWDFSCPVCSRPLARELMGAVEGTRRLARHLWAIHPFEAALLRVALNAPVRDEAAA